MNSKKQIAVVVLIAGIISAALSLGAASPEKPTFEYMVESFVDPGELNKRGAEGWELVSVTAAVFNGSTVVERAYLKRLKR